MLQPFQWQHLDAPAVADRLAGVAVLVDQAVHAPGQVVFQRVGRKGRQRTHAHLHVVQRFEALCQVVGDDADEARCQAALRHEGSASAAGQLLDGTRGGHVLGQVEVVAAGLARQRGGGHGQVVGQRVDDRVVAAAGTQRGQQRRRVFAVDPVGGEGRVDGMVGLAGDPRQRGGVLVHHGDLVVAAGGQQAGDGLADVAGAEQGDLHDVGSRSKSSG